MFNYKPVLAAAVIALAAPLAMTSPSFAQLGASTSHGGGGHGGGGHTSRGGGGGGHMGGGRHMAGGGWHGGGHHGGWNGHRGYGGGGFFPGVVAGAAIGSAFASPYYYDDNSYGYYDDGPTVEVAPSGGDDVAYCQQRFQSYDVGSGTYLGYDGMRHPCP